MPDRIEKPDKMLINEVVGDFDMKFSKGFRIMRKDNKYILCAGDDKNRGWIVIGEIYEHKPMFKG